MSTLTEKQEPQKVQLYDEQTFKNMGRWYDQQIVLARKSKELADLKASIAESHLKENYAYTQMARIAAPAPEDELTSSELKKSTQTPNQEKIAGEPERTGSSPAILDGASTNGLRVSEPTDE